MAYRYRSRRSSRKLAQKSNRNFIITLLIIVLLMYLTITWILPYLINGIGFVKGILIPAKKTVKSTSSTSLAPPVLNIPYEATNTAQINITGYGTPNSKVVIFLDNEKKDTANILEDGSFEIKNLKLVLGTNNIFAKSIDESNQESLPTKTFKVIFDNEKPSLNISEPEDNKQIQDGDKRVRIAGTAETGAKLFINNSQIIVDIDGKFSSDQALNEGDNIFNIKAVDIASNITEVQIKVTYKP